MATEGDGPSIFLADQSNISHQAFAATELAAGHADFYLCGESLTLKEVFQSNAEAERVAHAELAHLSARAGLDIVKAQFCGLAGRHVEVVVYGGKVFFLDTDQSETLPGGDFDDGYVVFFHHIGDGQKILAMKEAPGNSGNDGVGGVVSLENGMLRRCDVHGWGTL